MNNYKCYGLLFIPNYVNNKLEIEIIDLNYTNINNIEGIIQYIINVFKIDNFDIIYSPLDFDHYKMLWN